MARPSGNLLLNSVLVLFLGAAAVLLFAFGQRLASPRPDPERLHNPGNLIGDFIQLEVMNGAGVDGLAAEMSDYLRDVGFDVVAVDNYVQSDVARTVVMDRIGNPDAAQQISLALGLEEDRIQQELKPTWFLDASVIIGQDYASLKPFVDRLPPPSVDE
ncbi:MAG: LytR family transcriptional regulator [Bacteroidetes bacterium]|nr:LytR family transcriptional regulator [Bacteroidota bacterium]